MISFSQLDLETNGEYLKLLQAISKLSGLFNDSATPYINYRAIENIFCRSFGLLNLSRADIAFDVKYKELGIGLKTFVAHTDSKFEKIAEFNSLSKEIFKYKGIEQACKLAEFRNARIDLAMRLYDIKESLYHIVARRNGQLILFETDYKKIDLCTIHSVTTMKSGLQFKDRKNSYSFNYSKSTLFRKFVIPKDAFVLPIKILKDPYKILLELLNEKIKSFETKALVKGKNYVVLPLYGIKNGQKFVYERSALNQWNAKGRKRDYGEVYIKIPIEIHRRYPDFFLGRDEPFELEVPTGEIFSAKICQDNSKALMTNPNKALADWLLRRVFQVQAGELLTIEKMNLLGFDSVALYKIKHKRYKIDKAKTGSYDEFIGE